MQRHTIPNDPIYRELRKVNNQLNPAPALLKFFALVSALLFTVLTIGMVLQVLAREHTAHPFFSTKYGLFASPCYPPVGVKKDKSCR